MAIDGTYGFTYAGADGIGIGLFTIDDQKLRGVDYAGGRYHGTAKENADGSISLDIEFEVKPGELLVQGTSPQEVPYRRTIKETMPAQFGDGVPLTITSPPGTLYVMVKRIPDEWARAVSEGVTLKIGRD